MSYTGIGGSSTTTHEPKGLKLISHGFFAYLCPKGPFVNSAGIIFHLRLEGKKCIRKSCFLLVLIYVKLGVLV